MRAIITASLLAILASTSGHAAGVHCYDEARGLVQWRAEKKCRFKVISQAEADKVRADRSNYMRRAITRGLGQARETMKGVGSGFYISADGGVVTNKHVVEECQKVSILTPSGKTIPARVRAMSAQYDLALLQTGKRPETFAQVAKTAPKRGSMLKIVGFPAPKRPRVQPMAISGRYVGQRKSRLGANIMSIDATVWRGSSGSPVLAGNGQVVGVVFAKMDVPAVYAATSSLRGESAFGPPPDRVYAASVDALRTFLRRNSVPLSASSDGLDAPESYSVRVNCFGS